jgi:hypothetical protein
MDFQPGTLCTSHYNPTFDLYNNDINLAVSNAGLPNSPNVTWWTQVTTSWQTLGTILLRITDNTDVENCSWLPALMDPSLFVQVEKTFSPAGIDYYSGITTVGTPIASLYMGRIYSGAWGWSQVGSTVNDQQYLNWATLVNTSVWDTVSPGGVGTIHSTDLNCQAANLRIHPGAKLNIAAGGELNVAGTTEITEPNALWIQSNNSATGEWMDQGEGSILYNGSSSIRVQCYIGHDKWRGIAIPLHTTYARATFLGTYLKWYDEQRSVNESNNAAKWRYVLDVSPAPDSALTGDLRGWMNWSTLSMTGDYTINYSATTSNHLVSGSLTSSLTRTAFLSGTDPYDGWNMVGNMYTSPIDWEAASGWTRANVDPTAYFWNSNSGQYASYNYSTHLGTSGGTRYIPAMQGYFVHVTSATLFGMNNNVRVFNSQAFWKDQTTFEDLLDLKVVGNGSKDEAKIWFNASATADFDWEYDNYKLFGNDGTPQLYSILADNHYASVNTLPWVGVNTLVPMGFSLSIDSTTDTITASNMESFKSGMRIYLEDTKLAIMHELTADPVYIFTSTPNDAPNRFVLHFYNPFYGVENKDLASMQIYSFDEYVYVRNLAKGTTKGIIEIYDILGRKVFQENLKDMDLNKFLPGVNEGYYMVRVVTEDNSYSQKVYLK